jgi:hypothetical protein
MRGAPPRALTTCVHFNPRCHWHGHLHSAAACGDLQHGQVSPLRSTLCVAQRQQAQLAAQHLGLSADAVLLAEF